jgi:diphthamide synthase (EF-2-diphthine--ammonia ligase)
MSPREVKEQLQEDVLTILESYGIDEALEGTEYNRLVSTLCDTIITNLDKLD